uniref:Uncharacterized protein n=1 Tax=Triticum urartu TaxID=4572 RepID=A0A8R7V641_TRIUA
MYAGYISRAKISGHQEVINYASIIELQIWHVRIRRPDASKLGVDTPLLTGQMLIFHFLPTPLNPSLI